MPTIFVMLLLFACFSCIHVILSPQRRISHLILFAGGLFLLTRGRRFTFEFILLAMPVIKDTLASITALIPSKEKKVLPVKVVLLCLLGIIPFFFLHSNFKNFPKFPTSNTNLPRGVTTFLNKINTGGAVLNQPNMGGYLQWALYPKYKIFMDMEVPFLFTDEDMYVALKMYTDDYTFNRILTQYNPPFISVQLVMTTFPSLISKYPQYRPVFFDDLEALYVDEKQYPVIVKEYQLKHIDPFTFSQLIASGFKGQKDVDMILTELETMYRVDPENGVVNRGLSTIYREKDDYQKAIYYADAIIRNYPESPTGYASKGQAEKRSKQYEEALKSYKIVLQKQPGIAAVYKDIGLIYFEQKKYRKAYKNLIRAQNLYSLDISYKDLYYLIYSAVKANLRKDAEILLRYSLETLPPDDKEWNAKYEELKWMLAGSAEK